MSEHRALRLAGVFVGAAAAPAEQSEQEGLRFVFWGVFNRVVSSDPSVSKNKSWFLVPNQPSGVTSLIPVLSKNGLVALSVYKNCRCL